MNAIKIGCWAIIIRVTFLSGVWAQKSSDEDIRENWREKSQFYTGITLEIIEVHDRRDGLPFFWPTPMIWGLGLGGNYVFSHRNDFLSLSVNPNLNLALSFSGGGFNFMFQVPAYVLGRIGANCTNFNRQKVGGGLGLGFNYTYVQFPYWITGGASRFSQNFVAPSACAELTFRFRAGPFILRVHSNLLPFNDELQDGFERIPLRFMNYGFAMLWYFNMQSD